MSKESKSKHQKISPDWIVQGVLAKIGDSFDRLTGRGWKPGGSLATSELIERLLLLLDSEVRIDENGRKFVPHNIKLKMQWDKFSTDSEIGIKKLEAEFLAAAVDHIDERRYYTYAPLAIEIKPDYFVSGVKLFVSFDKFTDDDREAEITVDVPDTDSKKSSENEANAEEPSPDHSYLNVRFVLNGEQNEIILGIKRGFRYSLGRTKENDVSIDDVSVSKHHVSLLLDNSGKLLVADVGSTNGTFINGNRIAYGEVTEIEENDVLRLGEIEVLLQMTPRDAPDAAVKETEPSTVAIGNKEFRRRMEMIEPIKLLDEGDLSEVKFDSGTTTDKVDFPETTNQSQQDKKTT